MLDAPCWYSGDHHWPRDGGGACTQCGARLRCVCGRFIKVADLDAHIDSGKCPSFPGGASSEPPEEPER